MIKQTNFVTLDEKVSIILPDRKLKITWATPKDIKTIPVSLLI